VVAAAGIFVHCAGTALAATHSSPAGYRYVNDVLFDHKVHMQELNRMKVAPLQAVQRDVADVAVIEDDGTLLIGARDNPFDLDFSSVEFTPRGAGAYDFSCIGSAFDSTAGTPVTLGDDTCTYVAFTGGFTFTFYGTTYTGVYICSNGCLTFEEEEDVYFQPSVAEFLYEEPRVAPFYADIDPTRKGTVTYRQDTGSFTVTWDDVSEYREGDDLNSNTFQVRLDSTGTIVFSYNGMDATDAIVGLSPGGEIEVSVLDFDVDCPASPTGPAVIERFETPQSADPEVDYVLLSRLFYRTHGDEFDYLVLFTDFDVSLGGFYAFEVTVRNDVLGLGDMQEGGNGDDVFDNTAAFGSAGRLQSVLHMGEIRRYSTDPDQNIRRTNTSFDLLAHESGHRWLAFAQFIDGALPSTELLGRQMAHWSFYLDSDASFMEGNDWQDNGDGTFTSVAASERYSDLDLYLMGFIPPEDVDPFFVITDTGPDSTPGRAPEIGVTVSGQAKWVTIDDVVAAIGPRVPASRTAQRHFRQAFILLVENGQTPKPESIDKLGTLQNSWEQFFYEVTRGQATIDTSLQPVKITRTPAGSRAVWVTLVAMLFILGVASLVRRHAI